VQSPTEYAPHKGAAWRISLHGRFPVPLARGALRSRPFFFSPLLRLRVPWRIPMEDGTAPTKSPSPPAIDASILDALLQNAEQLCKSLTTPQSWHRVSYLPSATGTRRFENHPHRPPRCAGVYIIRHDDDGVLYVGESDNVRQRLCNSQLNHGRSLEGFRGKVLRRYNLSPDKVRPYLNEHCNFAWLEVRKGGLDVREFVEKLIITWMRASKQPLLNSSRQGKRPKP